MKTEQEQIEKMMLDIPQTIIAYDANPKGQHLYGEQRLQIAEVLYDKGYGRISEYKAEIERLEAETSNISRETAREILDMLYDMSIDKEILECCRIFDVNGVSLAKQICEKYGVEIEK